MTPKPATWLTCTERQRNHPLFHSDGDHQWIAGHDGYLLNDYEMWWI